MRERSRCASIWPCQWSKTSGEPIAGAGPETLTTRSTPAIAAASIAAHSCSTCVGVLQQIRKRRWVPRSARSSESGSPIVADGELDVQMRGAVGVADERAHGDPAFAQGAHDVRADGAGRAGHEYLHRIPPPLGGMLTLKRKTLSGSMRSLSATSRGSWSP